MSPTIHSGSIRQLHKFGGSSLADPNCYRRVASLIKKYSQTSDLVVVSAAGKTTNHLIACVDALESDGRVAHEILQQIRQFQQDLIQKLLPAELATPLLAKLHKECEVLGQLTFPVSDAQRNFALGHGELWSARLLTALLNSQGVEAVAQDSRQCLRAERGAQPQVDLQASKPLIDKALQGDNGENNHKRIVFTGFMASNQQGDTVLLGRNGSDYSATVIGQLAEVDRVTIWSDVAGVFSADPRQVKTATLLPWLRLDEANELARLASPVLHSRTLQPVAQSHMDLHLRCSYQDPNASDDAGEQNANSTRIERMLATGRGAKIITSLEDIVLLEMYLPKQSDPAQVEQQKRSISEFLATCDTQALASHWLAGQKLLRFAYSKEVAQDIIDQLTEQFSPQLVEADDAKSSLDDQLVLSSRHGYRMVAAVGAGVLHNPQHRYAFYQVLKKARLEFIDQTKSGLSLVAILPPNQVENDEQSDSLNDLNRIVNALHTDLFQAQKKVAIVLCGKGNIGSNWLELFEQQQGDLERRTGMRFMLVGIVSRTLHYLDLDGIDPQQTLAEFRQKGTSNTEQDWLEQLSSYYQQYDEIVVMDATASEEIAARYIEMAQKGMHVICANKIAGSSPLEQYSLLKEAFDKTGRYWLYNATVGAGLPINHTIRDLRESGDKIMAISGIFSGTLSWLFQQFDDGMSFSQLVDAAWQQGLTEPDPRHDLDGSDVMKKLVILAREAGFTIDPSDVKVESLVPAKLKSLSLDKFFNAADELDRYLNERLHDAKDQGKVLRYIARWHSDGRASVGLEALDPDHAFANLKPCDNIFAIESQWYKDNPLIIIGPAGGKFVSAGALQSDLNRLAELF